MIHAQLYFNAISTLFHLKYNAIKTLFYFHSGGNVYFLMAGGNPGIKVDGGTGREKLTGSGSVTTSEVCPLAPVCPPYLYLKTGMGLRRDITKVTILTNIR